MPDVENTDLERLERAAAEAERRAADARAKAAAAVAAQQRAKQDRLDNFDAQIANAFDRDEADARVEAATVAFREAVADDDGDVLRRWIDVRNAIALRTRRHQEAEQAAGRLRLAGKPLPGRRAGQDRQADIGQPTPEPNPDFLSDFTAAVERSAREKAEAERAETHRAREAAGDAGGP